jgi:CheY-like chemotaxis protein
MGLPSQFGSMRILVAEDDPTNQRLLEAMLGAFGVGALVVSDGAAAVARVTEDAPFDLILMDINMPVMDGLTAIARIRQFEEDAERRPAPIYVISSAHDESALEASAKAGADAHLPKPLPIMLLLYAVADGLKRRSMGASSVRPMPFGQAVSSDALAASTCHTGVH